MAREAIRRGAASPSPLSSPTPSAVAAFAVRKDTASPFAPSAAFRDVSSPLSASHASLTTDPVLATLSPRPMSPVAYRIDHNAASASAAPYKANYTQTHSAASAARQAGINEPSAHPQSSTTVNPHSAATSSVPGSSADKTNERAFYCRILFQDLPSAPTITHDGDLDHEIYLLLAYLLRETVLPWYSKLTPDREFLTQITSIITSIIHTVVQRQTSGASGGSPPATRFESDIHAPRSVPAAELPRIHDLLSRDIPLILRQHCSDFREAQRKADSIWAPLGTLQSPSNTAATLSQAEQDQQRRQRVHEQLPSACQEAIDLASRSSAPPLRVAQLFYAASPHPGLEPSTGSLDGKIELGYLRSAVLNLISSLLPADEYAPDTEKFIVRDVLVTVLRGALARSFRPWFFVQSIHKTLDAAGWPRDSTLPSVNTDGSRDESKPAADTSASTSNAVAMVVGLLARLPSILLQAWMFIVFTALPFLLRAYLDVFNVQRAASRKRRKLQQQQQQKPEEVSNHERFASEKGTFPPSLSTGSLYEGKMHGRFPSRKFQFSHDDTITAQGRSSAIDANATLTQAGLIASSGNNGSGDLNGTSKETLDEADFSPDYVGYWLDVAEEMLLADSHVLLRATFGVARTVLGTTGLDESVNRIAMRRINAELWDTQKLTKMVRELRRILLPDGHFPPSVPDPDVEMQEAEWIRLRTRLVCGAKGGEDAFVSWLVKKMLLGSAQGGISRGDQATRVKDTQIQVQRLTTWLEPFCSPQAAGPNTLLAILLLERVVVALCPDLTLA